MATSKNPERLYVVLDESDVVDIRERPDLKETVNPHAGAYTEFSKTMRDAMAKGGTWEEYARALEKKLWKKPEVSAFWQFNQVDSATTAIVGNEGPIQPLLPYPNTSTTSSTSGGDVTISLNPLSF